MRWGFPTAAAGTAAAVVGVLVWAAGIDEPEIPEIGAPIVLQLPDPAAPSGGPAPAATVTPGSSPAKVSVPVCKAEKDDDPDDDVDDDPDDDFDDDDCND